MPGEIITPKPLAEIHIILRADGKFDLVAPMDTDGEKLQSVQMLCTAIIMLSAHRPGAVVLAQGFPNGQLKE